MIKLLKKLQILLIIILLLSSTKVFSQSLSVPLSEIQNKIEDHSDKIRQLDAEIKTYEKQIEAVGGEAKNLQSAIQVLDISQKKIGTEIKKTETNIQKTNLTISNLWSEISDIEKKINTNTEAISKILNDMRESDEESLIESFLTNKSISQVLDEYETGNQFQTKVRTQSIELEAHKNELSDKKTTTEKEKKKLLNLKGELGDQNQILVINKKEKSTLLTATKNKETEYKKILTNKQAEKEKFERELFLFESQLKKAIDPNSFPTGKKGILSWPLDNILITQPFGQTVDSKKLYVSGTHNGVDFKASRGTRVMSVGDGVVEGVGNTDEQRGCYSYGKWVLIKHENGLSSMYAHFDLIKVAPGQEVKAGDVIGYSGQTGYATGPHLHLTLYASQGVEIQKYSSSINCKNVSIPVANSKAYLDPMLYF